MKRILDAFLSPWYVPRKVAIDISYSIRDETVEAIVRSLRSPHDPYLTLVAKTIEDCHEKQRFEESLNL